MLDHGFQKAHGFGLQKYGLIAFPVTYRSCPETVGDHPLRWIRAVAAVVVRWKVFSSHRKGGALFVYCFSIVMKKEKIECGGCGGIWEMSLTLGRNLPGIKYQINK